MPSEPTAPSAEPDRAATEPTAPSAEPARTTTELTAPSAEPARLRADAERNRRRLLQAAREVFAERGVDVTLDEIARHAGVGVGTAYRRFPNKDALIEALMVDKIHQLGAIARECLEDPDPWRGLVGYLERALAMQSADRGLTEVLFSAATGREQVAVARQTLAPVVTKLVRRAVDAGVVRSDLETTDIPLINFMLVTLVNFGREVEPELYRRFLAIVLDGLRPQPEPLPVEALNYHRFTEAMANWRGR